VGDFSKVYIPLLRDIPLEGDLGREGSGRDFFEDKISWDGVGGCRAIFKSEEVNVGEVLILTV
jgi:hypothetical protein